MDPTWERRPTSETPKAPTKKLNTDSISAEDRHAAFCAGLEQGRAERVEIEVEDQVQARLHTRTLEALGMAKRYAAAKGPAWSALVMDCAERDD